MAKLLTFFPRIGGPYSDLRGGTYKVDELEDNLTLLGYERVKSKDSSEYKYEWHNSRYNMVIHVHYRFGNSGRPYAWLSYTENT